MIGFVLIILLLYATNASANYVLFERAEELTASDDIIGLAIAVVRDGKVEAVRTYGKRDLKSEAPVEPTTVFRIASLSKGFTASLIAMLTEEGALSFDDPITSFVSDFRLKHGRQSRATLGAILSHRVGLPPYAYDNLLEAGTSPATIRTRLGGVDPICNVGACYAYQNVAFDAARFAIETKQEASFAEALAERLFIPLQMNSASVGMAPFIAAPTRAISYTRHSGKGAWREKPVRSAYYNVPAAGGINASIADMAMWLLTQMGGAQEILSEDVRAMMHSPQVETRAERRMRSLRAQLNNAWYGYGWRIYDYGGSTVINHSGSVEGYSAQIAFLPEHDVGVVLLTNSRSREFFELLPTFLNDELDLPAFGSSD
ncbi:MAG: beta-lactamase family protein [Marinicaulis sp.]|nr:beta-lactamase family protein [Marinicaulis sp.]